MVSEERFIIKQRGYPNSGGWKLVNKQEDDDGFFYQFEHKRLGSKIISGPEITSEEYNIVLENTEKPSITIPLFSNQYQGLYAPERTLNTVGKKAVEEDPYLKLTLNALDEAYRQQKAAEAAAGPRPPAPPRERPVFEEPGFRPTRGGRRIRRTHRKTKRHSKTKRRSHRR